MKIESIKWLRQYGLSFNLWDDCPDASPLWYSSCPQALLYDIIDECKIQRQPLVDNPSTTFWTLNHLGFDTSQSASAIIIKWLFFYTKMAVDRNNTEPEVRRRFLHRAVHGNRQSTQLCTLTHAWSCPYSYQQSHSLSTERICSNHVFVQIDCGGSRTRTPPFFSLDLLISVMPLASLIYSLPSRYIRVVF